MVLVLEDIVQWTSIIPSINIITIYFTSIIIYFRLSLAVGYTHSNYFLGAKTQYDITSGNTNFTASIYSKQGDLEAALQSKYTLYADKPQLAIAAK